MNLKKIVLLGGIGLASAAAGLTIPRMMSGQSHDTAEAPKAEAAHGKDDGHGKKEKKPATKADDHGSSGHGAAAPSGHGDPKEKGKSPGGEKSHVEGTSFVSFGRTVVNLNDPNLVKYLSLEITLEVEADDEEDTKLAIEARKPKLQTWLTGHLADKTVDDVRGKVGVNRLRREIQDNFNALLFSDGRERIRDICFDEFHIH